MHKFGKVKTFVIKKRTKVQFQSPVMNISLTSTMASSSANLRRDSAKVISKQDEILFPSMRSSYTSSRRTTNSFSSSSSSSLDSSYNNFLHDFPLSRPATPLRFSGVPFSWEHLPGIPKKQASKKLLIKDGTAFLLPLPPPTTSKQVSKKPIYREKTSGKKKKKHASKQSIERDPFFDALVECSKDTGGRRKGRHRWNQMEASRESRSLSDRLGSIGLYSSCKRSCATAESIVCTSSNFIMK